MVMNIELMLGCSISDIAMRQESRVKTNLGGGVLFWFYGINLLNYDSQIKENKMDY